MWIQKKDDESFELVPSPERKKARKDEHNQQKKVKKQIDQPKKAPNPSVDTQMTEEDWEPFEQQLREVDFLLDGWENTPDSLSELSLFSLSQSSLLDDEPWVPPGGEGE